MKVQPGFSLLIVRKHESSEQWFTERNMGYILELPEGTDLAAT